jgi:hypothetical protein
MLTSNTYGEEKVIKNGEVITVSFQTTHPVILESALLANQDIKFSSNNKDGMNWSAEYIVENGDTLDNDFIALYFTVDDLAGNNTVTVTEDATITKKIRYYAPLEITDVVITTNNSNDPAKYAKDGDTITVQFTTNHDVSLSNATIAGKEPVQKKQKKSRSNIAKDWTLTYTLKNGDVKDLETIPFTFTVDDIAGNKKKTKKHTDKDVTNSIGYFAPIEAVSSISTDNVDSTFAKNGDRVIVKIKANHNVSFVSSLIFSRTTQNTGDNSMELTASYSIPDNETRIPEGSSTFEYTITDLAGNQLAVKETNDKELSKVTYDRTNPEVVIAPNFSGFTNESVLINVIYKDTNFARQGVSLLINDVEQISGRDRSLMSGENYTKSLELEQDNAYKIVASVKDKASNQSTPDPVSYITIDKTNPRVTSVKIDFEVPKTFQAGFNISEFFHIEEDYIKEIICNVSDMEGVHEWDINMPITTDGKKTIYLLATDLADNYSAAVTYDLYIDGTAPKPVIKESLSNRELTSGARDNTFISAMSLDISLEQLHIGDEEPDYFTELVLLDKDRNVVADLLEDGQISEEGSYRYHFDEFGPYILSLSAKDGVGNETGTMEYEFILKDKSLFQKYYENKFAFYGSIAALTTITTGSVITIKIKRRKSNPGQDTV